MSSLIAQGAPPTMEVVDLASVRPRELETFWRREVSLWQDRLHWDVSSSVSALRRAVERGGLEGKAVRINSSTAAYSYYVVEADRGILSGFVVSSDWSGLGVGDTVLESVLSDLRRRRVRRVETQFLAFDGRGLVPCFERAGFHTFWRDFLRVPVSAPRALVPRQHAVQMDRWNGWNLTEATMVMAHAHRGGVDAQMNELYRSKDGCRVLLNNILRQRGCGACVTDACAVARPSRGAAAAGFSLVTEISHRHAHLAQVAVMPELQKRGVGRALLDHSLARLREKGFETLSLMVSRRNERALRLYRGMGFEPVFDFPVFVWQR